MEDKEKGQVKRWVSGIQTPDMVVKRYPLLPSVRFLFFIVLLIGNILSSVAFTILHFTIVCMVNSTSLTTSDSTAEGSNGNFSSSPSSSSCRHNQELDHSDDPQHSGYAGDISWSREQQANIVAAYMWGLVMLTLPTGILLDKFGSKSLMAFGTVASAISLFLTPIVVYFGEWPFFVLRMLLGTTGGLYWPLIIAVSPKWLVKQEVGKMSALASTGFPLGAVLANFSSGYFCSLDSHGWFYSFYFWGALNIMYLGLLWFLYTDMPENHPMISEQELSYIQLQRIMPTSTCISKDPSSQKKEKMKYKIPWIAILKCPAVWSIVVSNFVSGWVFTLVVVFIPTYIKDILGSPPVFNGIFSCLPSLLQVVGRFVFGAVSDKLSTRLDATTSIKLFDGIGYSIIGLFLFVVTFLDCQTALLAILFFSIGQLMYGATIGGYIRSTMCIAPDHVGLIGGVGETVTGVASLLVPYMIGLLTSQGTADQWNVVLYISTVVVFFGAAFVLFFASGKIQTWALRTPSEADPKKLDWQNTKKISIVS